MSTPPSSKRFGRSGPSSGWVTRNGAQVGAPVRDRWWEPARSRIGGVRAARRAAALPALDDIPADDVGDGRAADGRAAVPFEVIEQW